MAVIDDYIGYKFTCKINKDYENESGYMTDEFTISFEGKGPNYKVTGECNGEVMDIDPTTAATNIFMGTWDILKTETL